MLLPPNVSSSPGDLSRSSPPGEMVGASYLAPCSETPLLVMAFLLACVMVVSGYWIILKWVAKGNLDLPKLSSISGMMPRVNTIGRSIG